MDNTSLDLALKFIVGLATAYGVIKIASDLRLNRVAQKKQVAEMVQDMTGWLENQPATKPTHPMLVQAKFHAAFGGSLAHMPEGQEILDFLENQVVATFPKGQDYADCSEFVAYSTPEKSFVPRGSWTREKFRAKRGKCFLYYMITISPALALSFTSSFPVSRFFLAIPLAAIAVANAVRSAQVRRAGDLLQPTEQRAKPEAHRD